MTGTRKGFTALAVLVSLGGYACSKAADAPADSTAAITDTAAAVVAPAAESVATPGSADTATIVKIDLNTATDAEILKIPGVGARMLHEFKEYRPYKSMEQFRREIGKYVDKTELARLEQYVFIK